MKEILISISPEETRMALLENGRLAEYEIERPFQSHLVGNIYKGQVQNVLPGMQAAFVDIKKKKNAFLYIGESGPITSRNTHETAICLHKGQSVMVQITKDSAGTKGPRATTHITLPGRNFVLMPLAAYIGVSHRISDENERLRLKNIAEKYCPMGMGLIIRTAAIGRSEEALAADIRYLTGLWETLKASNNLLSAPALLYRDADLLIRVVRDFLTEDVDRLLIDNATGFKRIIELAGNISSDLAGRVELYEGNEALFTKFAIDDAINNLQSHQVTLPSGVFLVIDKTEALTVIDVNTGSFVGEGNLSDTIYQTNIEAAEEILRQLRLRDIGGIIIVDFIDMDSLSDKEALLEFMRIEAKKDRTKTNVVGITHLGLVEITRKKSRKNYESIVYTECPCCNGTGRIESAETIGVKICRNLRRLELSRHASGGYDILLNSRLGDYQLAVDLIKQVAAELSVGVKISRTNDLSQKAYQINYLL